MARRTRLLLDTHVLLYWLARDTRLSDKQREAVERASPDDPIWVSDISLWEIATLAALGRIALQIPVRDFLESAVAPPLVRRVGISPAVAAEVAQLPETFYRDPADRVIVASARAIGATLLTQDERLIAAGLVPTID